MQQTNERDVIYDLKNQLKRKELELKLIQLEEEINGHKRNERHNEMIELLKEIKALLTEHRGKAVADFTRTTKVLLAEITENMKQLLSENEVIK